METSETTVEMRPHLHRRKRGSRLHVGFCLLFIGCVWLDSVLLLRSLLIYFLFIIDLPKEEEEEEEEGGGGGRGMRPFYLSNFESNPFRLMPAIAASQSQWLIDWMLFVHQMWLSPLLPSPPLSSLGEEGELSYKKTRRGVTLIYSPIKTTKIRFN